MCALAIWSRMVEIFMSRLDEVAPLGFRQRWKELSDLGKLPLSVGPCQVLPESELLLNWHRFIPRRENQRGRGIPAALRQLASVFQHSKKLTPVRGHRHEATVCGGVMPE